MIKFIIIFKHIIYLLKYIKLMHCNCYETITITKTIRVDISFDTDNDK